MRLVKEKNKIINVSEKQRKKKEQIQEKKVLAANECLEKLRHTILINYNHGNLKFGMDEYDHIDCESLEEFGECYDTILKTLATGGE